MRRIGSQDYAVVQQDFPVKIVIEGFDLAVYQCVPSRVVVTRPDGAPVTVYDLALEPVAGNPMARACAIPNTDPPAEITFTFVVGYDTPSGTDPRYEVRMRAASGDNDKRTIRPPDRSVTTHFEYR